MNVLTSLQKKMLVSFLIFGISLWHYTTSIHHPIYHVIHRELYLIPIVLAAYWFGKKGGLTVSVIASALFLPWAFQSAHVSTSYHVNNVLEILMFNGVAYLLGVYRDASKARFTTFRHPRAEDLGVHRQFRECAQNGQVCGR
jgi:glucose-6-phosphate-specific signal transduction histidine kinase